MLDYPGSRNRAQVLSCILAQLQEELSQGRQHKQHSLHLNSLEVDRECKAKKYIVMIRCKEGDEREKDRADRR